MAAAAHAGIGKVSHRTLADMTLLFFVLFAVGLGIAAFLVAFSESPNRTIGRDRISVG